MKTNRQTRRGSGAWLILVGVPLLFALAMIPYARSVGCSEMTAQWNGIPGALVTVGIVILGFIVYRLVSQSCPSMAGGGRCTLAAMNLGLIGVAFTTVTVVAALVWLAQQINLVSFYLGLIGC